MTAVLLAWVVIVVLFFTASSGKRGLYVLPAVPALAMAAGPWLPELLRSRGPRRLAFVLACVLTGSAALAAAYLVFDAERAARISTSFGIEPVLPLAVISACGALALVVFRVRDGWLAYAGVLGSMLALAGYMVNPRLDAMRSGRTFVERLEVASAGVVELAMIGSKEQYLLQLRRPSFNFGHARWQEGEWQREAADAAAWLALGRSRAVLVDRRALDLCFVGAAATDLGRAHGKHWFLVSSRPDPACAESGDPSSARLHAPPVEALNTVG
jgi:4-amino-4-deoxy-L-arabinose transferase-like glycosyltransferase